MDLEYKLRICRIWITASTGFYAGRNERSKIHKLPKRRLDSEYIQKQYDK